MINFEEELKKFHPSLEVEDAEEAIYNQDLTDAADLLVKMIKESEEKEVNIKVEAEKPPKKSHYGSIFLAIFIILIILAIGFAAYYFLINYLD